MKVNNLHRHTTFLARLAIGFSVFTLLLLALLHVLSPEFDPSWRMVSEYATGKYGWVLSLFFVSWAISSWVTAAMLWHEVTTKKGAIGLIFLILAGVGEAMAAVFDITQSLHSVAAFVGIGGFMLSAILISLTLAKSKNWSVYKRSLLWTGNLVWVSVLVMIGTFILLIVTYTQSGGNLRAGAINYVPQGVIAIVGYANRLLIIIFCAWVINVSLKMVRIHK